MTSMLSLQARVAYEERRRAYLQQNKIAPKPVAAADASDAAVPGDPEWEAAVARANEAKENPSLSAMMGGMVVQETRRGPPPAHASAICDRQVLDCEIPSDLDSLDMLNAYVPWLPSSATIRPTEMVLAQKRMYMDVVSRSYGDIGDRVLQDIFGYQTQKDDTGVLRAVVPDDAPLQRKLHPHKFPYNLPNETNHYVLWYTGKAPDLHADTITAHLKQEIRMIIPATQAAAFDDGEDVFEFAWYENPKMTVPQVYHVQAFWRMKPATRAAPDRRLEYNPHDNAPGMVDPQRYPDLDNVPSDFSSSAERQRTADYANNYNLRGESSRTMSPASSTPSYYYQGSVAAQLYGGQEREASSRADSAGSDSWAAHGASPAERAGEPTLSEQRAAHDQRSRDLHLYDL